MIVSICLFQSTREGVDWHRVAHAVWRTRGRMS
jgi:hypothetical protein